MAHSKNDFYFVGGTARMAVRETNGKQESKLMLINPSTRCPYTYKEIVQDLTLRKEKYPILAEMIDTQLKQLQEKAAAHPQSVFCRICTSPIKVPDNATEEAVCKAKQTARETVIQKSQKVLQPGMVELARLLYRPFWENNIESGNITIRQFVTYMGADIFSDTAPSMTQPLTGLLHRVILPIVGDIRCSEFTKEEQEKCIGKINRSLNREGTAMDTKRGNVKHAYRLLFQAIEANGYRFQQDPYYLADLLDTKKRQNRALLDASRATHLDASQRQNLFQLLLDPTHLYVLFILGLFYSGLGLDEIPALLFSDFLEIISDECNCYAILVDRCMRKRAKRYSTITATNADFSVNRLRIVVLYPWAKDILLRYIRFLHKEGYEPDQISRMRLSDQVPGGPIMGPEELKNLITPLLAQADILSTQIPRTAANGKVTLQTIPADMKLLRSDAQYVASVLCGMSQPMLNTMFGLPANSVDEQNYLDVYSPRYTIIRYLHLRRFSPIDSLEKESSTNNLLRSRTAQERDRYLLHIENNTNEEQTLSLSANYAICAHWKQIK